MQIVSRAHGCILLKFYIKPQLFPQYMSRDRCCILLKFYIKPQQPRACVRPRFVVSYWNSTSNHNYNRAAVKNGRLYLIEILHQTTTFRAASGGKISCILLKFYIKPQQSSKYLDGWPGCILLKFYIKPQLDRKPYGTTSGCILLKFYIKPQRSAHQGISIRSCILLKFYIKPQPSTKRRKRYCVVSYWNSTSNHNNGRQRYIISEVVSYWNSTSNHNDSESLSSLADVVSYWNSTSNHNVFLRRYIFFPLYLIEILHQTTTMAFNRNYEIKLYLIEILHQTTTFDISSPVFSGCILLKFYIKPQQDA